MKLKTYPKPTDLVISTCTVVSNVSNDIDLNYFSRVVPIHDMYSNTLEEKNGGIYNITLYSDFSRGDTYDKKVKNKEFNNQVTIKYKYWGFRNINMKIFTNGKLQMTGLKTEEEAVNITNKIIKLLKTVSLKIHTSKKSLDKITNVFTNNISTNSLSSLNKSGNNSSNSCCKDKTTEFSYKNTISNSNNDNNGAYNDGFEGDINILSSNNDNSTNSNSNTDISNKDSNKDSNNYSNNYSNSNKSNSSFEFDFNSNFNEYQLVYSLKDNNINYYRWKNKNLDEIIKYLDNNNYQNVLWLNHKDTSKIITKLEEKYNQYETYSNMINEVFNKLRETLHGITGENEIKKFYNENGETIIKLIDEFNSLFKNHTFIWDTCINVKNENSFQYICQEFSTHINTFHTSFRKNILKIKNVNKSDVEILDKIKPIIQPKINKDIENISKDKNTIISQKNIDGFNWEVYMKDLYLVSPNYHISNINTELINSDYSCGFNINLNILSAFLKKKYNIYNSYKPDEYPGVLTKYYYHPENENQGICTCEPHCSSKEKKSRCCKITISIFRPGSIIITGAKSIEQLKHTYGVINKILKDNFNYLQGTEIEEDNTKKNPNDNRKICRKPRLFYIKKENIDTLPLEYVR